MGRNSMYTMHVTTDRKTETRTDGAFRKIKLLVGSYATISIVTMIAVVLLRNHNSIVTPAVWIRGTIVAFTSVLMLGFVRSASRGSGRGYLRLRIASAIMVVAIAVIILIPGAFPLWMKIEQGACGILLLGVVALANGARLRSAFAGKDD